jgi:hypothetical protein
MIVKGNQRGGGRALAAHLLNLLDNDHVEIQAISGLVSSDVAGAFLEIEAISRATRCTQPFFSVSISPPKGETVVIADFENAIAQVAEATGLSGQPRVVIFHEKQARRHCHVVFSRIDMYAVKAINLPFFKRRLTEISRELYLVHGFELPRGLADKSLADPTNFSLEEHQVAKRAERDPREVKAALKRCWATSDSAPAFKAALKEHGFWLCRGDRRGFVAIDYKANVYSLSRWLDVKPKELRARLGEPERFLTVAETEVEIADAISANSRRLRDKAEQDHVERMAPLVNRRREVVVRQRRERQTLAQSQRQKREEQALAHSLRLRRGLAGIWDWIVGKRNAAKRYMAAEIEETRNTQESEMHSLRVRHLEERAELQAKFEHVRFQRKATLQSLSELHDPNHERSGTADRSDASVRA